MLRMHGCYNDWRDRRGHSLWEHVMDLRMCDVLHFLKESPFYDEIFREGETPENIVKYWESEWLNKGWVVTHTIGGTVYSIYDHDGQFWLRQCEDIDLIDAFAKSGYKSFKEPGPLQKIVAKIEGSYR